MNKVEYNFKKSSVKSFERAVIEIIENLTSGGYLSSHFNNKLTL